ncbi:MAG: very short patch repair endonuclease [Nanoarchaeota archaeon]|nr:very short patch repair endonuclease [Nanoarchaeota archaeon]
MADVFTPEKRSEVMSRIRSKWTKPERTVHNYLKGHKIRHKMHPKMTGNPDVLLKDSNKVIFIHGCFWHRCPECFRKPQNRREYWMKKIENNIARHKRNVRKLRRDGWRVITIWEHEIRKNPNMCLSRLIE